MPDQQPYQQFNIPNNNLPPNGNPNIPGGQNQPPSVVRVQPVQNSPKKDKNPLTAICWFLLGLLFIALGTIIVITFLYNQNLNNANTKLEVQVAETERQRNEKNQIRDIWEEQAASNDELIIGEDNFISQVQSYIQEVNKTVRFVDGKAQVLETADKDRLDQAKADLDTDLENLTLTSEESITLKNSNKQKIDSIYLQGSEDQSNRANPRDGVR